MPWSAFPQGPDVGSDSSGCNVGKSAVSPIRGAGRKTGQARNGHPGPEGQGELRRTAIMPVLRGRHLSEQVDWTLYKHRCPARLSPRGPLRTHPWVCINQIVTPIARNQRRRQFHRRARREDKDKEFYLFLLCALCVLCVDIFFFLASADQAARRPFNCAQDLRRRRRTANAPMASRPSVAGSGAAGAPPLTLRVPNSAISS